MTQKTCVCFTVVQLQILFWVCWKLFQVTQHLYFIFCVTFFPSNMLFVNGWSFLRILCTPINSMLTGWGNSNYTHWQESLTSIVGFHAYKAEYVLFTVYPWICIFEFTLISAYHQQIFSYYCWLRIDNTGKILWNLKHPALKCKWQIKLCLEMLVLLPAKWHRFIMRENCKCLFGIKNVNKSLE